MTQSGRHGRAAEATRSSRVVIDCTAVAAWPAVSCSSSTSALVNLLGNQRADMHDPGQPAAGHLEHALLRPELSSSRGGW